MSVLDVALRCASIGWPVFPLRGKIPAISRDEGGRGFLDATCDADVIREWFTAPGLNVGLATGAASGVWVLDVDTSDGKGGLESITAASRQHAIPWTLTVRTGTGGFHIYFRYPGQKVKSRQAVFPGVDIRGDGGYVVIPPSIHPKTGQPYEVVRRADPVPAPGWLLDVACPPPPPPRPPLPPSRSATLPRAQADAERCRRLRLDPLTRERAGLALGGEVIGQGDTQRVRRVRCPSCGRQSVHWFLDPKTATKARCDHRNSCGWSGHVAFLLGLES